MVLYDELYAAQDIDFFRKSNDIFREGYYFKQRIVRYHAEKYEAGSKYDNSQICIYHTIHNRLLYMERSHRGKRSYTVFNLYYQQSTQIFYTAEEKALCGSFYYG